MKAHVLDPKFRGGKEACGGGLVADVSSLSLAWRRCLYGKQQRRRRRNSHSAVADRHCGLAVLAEVAARLRNCVLKEGSAIVSTSKRNGIRLALSASLPSGSSPLSPAPHYADPTPCYHELSPVEVACCPACGTCWQASWLPLWQEREAHVASRCSSCCSSAGTIMSGVASAARVVSATAGQSDPAVAVAAPGACVNDTCMYS